MSRQTGEMWSMLHQAGLTKGAAPGTGKPGSPWYVKVLLAFSGWLAALFLLGFIGTGFRFVFENPAAAFITGGMMISGVFVVLRISKNDFVEHLALAASLAGQALVVYAIFDISNRNEKLAWLLVVMLQVPLAVCMPNFVHRVFSSFVAAFAFNMALTVWGWPHIAGAGGMLLAAWCWLNEFRYPHQMRRIQSIGYGLVLFLLQLKGTTLLGYQTLGWQSTPNQSGLWTKPWVGEVLTGAVTLYVVWQLLHRYGQGISERISITALLGAFFLCAASLEVQGITIGMAIMLLGFAGANRVLLGLGIVSLLFNISSYYYLLDASLLAKSRTLLVVGLVLLALRGLMLKIIPVKKEAPHV